MLIPYWQTGLTPFVQRVYPGRHRFVQDNDPKHTLRIAQQYMADNNINWWRTPPESPDLNPIEMVWSALKRNLEREGKPRNKVQLIDCIKDFWRQHLTPQVCQNCIFTDECTVQLFWSGAPNPPWNTPQRCTCGAGISDRGATRVLVFEGRMDVRFYFDTILTNGKVTQSYAKLCNRASAQKTAKTRVWQSCGPSRHSSSTLHRQWWTQRGGRSADSRGRDDHGIVASLATVKRCRQRLGRARCHPKYCHFVKLPIRKRGCFSVMTWWMPREPCSTTLMTVYSQTNVQSSYFGAVPQTHRETPHKGARVGRDFGQRSNKGTCVRRTNGREILFRYHIDKRLHPIRPESVPRSA